MAARGVRTLMIGINIAVIRGTGVDQIDHDKQVGALSLMGGIIVSLSENPDLVFISFPKNGKYSAVADKENDNVLDLLNALPTSVPRKSEVWYKSVFDYSISDVMKDHSAGRLSGLAIFAKWDDPELYGIQETIATAGGTIMKALSPSAICLVPASYGETDTYFSESEIDFITAHGILMLQASFISSIADDKDTDYRRHAMTPPTGLPFYLRDNATLHKHPVYAIGKAVQNQLKSWTDNSKSERILIVDNEKNAVSQVCKYFFRGNVNSNVRTIQCWEQWKKEGLPHECSMEHIPYTLHENFQQSFNGRLAVVFGGTTYEELRVANGMLLLGAKLATQPTVDCVFIVFPGRQEVCDYLTSVVFHQFPEVYKYEVVQELLSCPGHLMQSTKDNFRLNADSLKSYTTLPPQNAPSKFALPSLTPVVELDCHTEPVYEQVTDQLEAEEIDSGVQTGSSRHLVTTGTNGAQINLNHEASTITVIGEDSESSAQSEQELANKIDNGTGCIAEVGVRTIEETQEWEVRAEFNKHLLSEIDSAIQQKYNSSLERTSCGISSTPGNNNYFEAANQCGNVSLSPTESQQALGESISQGNQEAKGDDEVSETPVRDISEESIGNEIQLVDLCLENDEDQNHCSVVSATPSVEMRTQKTSVEERNEPAASDMEDQTIIRSPDTSLAPDPNPIPLNPVPSTSKQAREMLIRITDEAGGNKSATRELQISLVDKKSNPVKKRANSYLDSEYLPEVCFPPPNKKNKAHIVEETDTSLSIKGTQQVLYPSVNKGHNLAPVPVFIPAQTNQTSKSNLSTRHVDGCVFDKGCPPPFLQLSVGNNSNTPAGNIRADDKDMSTLHSCSLSKDNTSRELALNFAQTPLQGTQVTHNKYDFSDELISNSVRSTYDLLGLPFNLKMSESALSESGHGVLYQFAGNLGMDMIPELYYSLKDSIQNMGFEVAVLRDAMRVEQIGVNRAFVAYAVYNSLIDCIKTSSEARNRSIFMPNKLLVLACQVPKCSCNEYGKKLGGGRYVARETEIFDEKLKVLKIKPVWCISDISFQLSYHEASYVFVAKCYGGKAKVRLYNNRGNGNFGLMELHKSLMDLFDLELLMKQRDSYLQKIPYISQCVCSYCYPCLSPSTTGVLPGILDSSHPSFRCIRCNGDKNLHLLVRKTSNNTNQNEAA